MSLMPKFTVSAAPTITADQLIAYMAAENAWGREAVLRAAKFPEPTEEEPYPLARAAVQKFFARRRDDPVYFDRARGEIQARIRRAEIPPGYGAQEAGALRAFKNTYDARRWSKYDFSPAPASCEFVVEGVRVSLQLDTQITEQSGPEGATGIFVGPAFAGGVVVVLASSPEAPTPIEVRRRQTCQLIYWALEESVSLTPLPRLCMVFDVFGGEVVKGTEYCAQFRKRAERACRAIAAAWPEVGVGRGV